MRWPLAAVAIVCVSGCASQAPMTNPFLGPTTVPPPPTGAAGTAPPADPYYQNPAATPGYQAPAYQSPQQTAPAYGTPSYQPPGGYAPPQGSGTRPLNNGGYGLSEPAREKVRATPGLRPAEESTSGHIAATGRSKHAHGTHTAQPPTRQQVARVDMPADASTFDSSSDGSGLAQATVRGNQTSSPDDATTVRPASHVASTSDSEISPSSESQAAASNVSDTPAPSPGQGTVIRIIEPRPQTVGPFAIAHQSGVEPRHFDQPDELIDINDLPRADDTRPTAAPHTSSRSSTGDSVSLASATVSQGPRTFASAPTPTSSVSHALRTRGEPSASSSHHAHTPTAGQASTTSRASTSSNRGGRYGHDASYQLLRGRLEYSATRRRWKLRYIPHDASQTDRFGGSVELIDNGELGRFEPGQFVVVEGVLTESEGDTYDFAPQYQVRSIRRQ